MPARLPVAVLLSGSGSNFQAMLDRQAQGLLDVEFRLVLANNPGAFGLERARQAGIPALALDHRAFPSREAFDAAMVQALKDHGAEAVALAGFMRLLTPVFLDAFPGRVLNIHPALLPSFPGAHGQRDAAAFGVRLAGCTVHLVDELMDHGPVIIQAAIPVPPGLDEQELARRILRWEHRVYPQALQWLARGRLRVDGRQAVVEGAPAPEAMADPPRHVETGPALVYPPLEPGF